MFIEKLFSTVWLTFLSWLGLIQHAYLNFTYFRKQDQYLFHNLC